jgi:hypothetical protein
MDGQRTDRDDLEKRIREVAHRIWEDEGRPPGQEKRHWEMAESLIDVGNDPIEPTSLPEPGPVPAQAAGTAGSPDTGTKRADAKPRAGSRTAAARTKSSRKSKRE